MLAVNQSEALALPSPTINKTTDLLGRTLHYQWNFNKKKNNNTGSLSWQDSKSSQKNHSFVEESLQIWQHGEIIRRWLNAWFNCNKQWNIKSGCMVIWWRMRQQAEEKLSKCMLGWNKKAITNRTTQRGNDNGHLFPCILLLTVNTRSHEYINI